MQSKCTENNAIVDNKCSASACNGRTQCITPIIYAHICQQRMQILYR